MSEPVRSLLGREPELARIGPVLDALRSGVGGLVWVEGDVGVGKTTLIEQIGSDAAGRGLTVLRGRGDPAQSELPLRVAAGLVGAGRDGDRGQVPTFASLVQGTDDAGPSGQSLAAAGERIVDLIQTFATEGPVLVVVDDVQSIDHRSEQVVRRLVRLAAQVPMVVLGGARTDTAGVLRHAVAATGGSVVLTLEPLRPDVVVQVAATRLGAEPGPRLRAELARAEGNALFVEELLVGAVARGLTRGPDGTVDLAGRAMEPASVTLRATVDDRLATLTPPTMRVLETAAVLGVEFDPHALVGALGVDVPTVHVALSEAFRAGVLADHDETVGFRHPLIWESLVARTPLAIRRALHAHIAEFLARDAAGFAEVVSHVAQGPARPQRWVAGWIAEQSAGDFETAPLPAVDVLTAVADSQPVGSTLWRSAQRQLMHLQFQLGRDARPAADSLTRAATGADDVADAVVVAGRCDVRFGEPAAAAVRFRDALTRADLTSVGRSRLLTWLANALFVSGDPEAAEVAAEAERLADEAGDVTARVEAVRVRSRLGMDPDLAAALLADVAALPQRPETAQLKVFLQFDRIVSLHALDRSAEREEVLQHTLVEAERWTPALADTIRDVAIGISYELGRWDDALAHADTFAGHDTAAQPIGRLWASIVAVARDLDDVAEPWLTSIGDTSAIPEAAFVHHLRGDVGLALAAGRQLLDRELGHRVSSNGLSMLVVDLALEAGDREVAERFAAQMQEDAAVLRRPVHVAELRCVEGQLADDPEVLRRSAQEFQERGYLPMAAHGHVLCATSLARAGDPARARASLNEATSVFDALGVTSQTRRADARLRALGVVRGPRSRHRRAVTGWEALTPAETQVALLVSQGLSNPAIADQLVCSRRTVETHVSKTMQKLGVTARAQVARHVPGAATAAAH